MNKDPGAKQRVVVQDAKKGNTKGLDNSKQKEIDMLLSEKKVNNDINKQKTQPISTHQGDVNQGVNFNDTELIFPEKSQNIGTKEFDEMEIDTFNNEGGHSPNIERRHSLETDEHKEKEMGENAQSIQGVLGDKMDSDAKSDDVTHGGTKEVEKNFSGGKYQKKFEIGARDNILPSPGDKTSVDLFKIAKKDGSGIRIKTDFNWTLETVGKLISNPKPDLIRKQIDAKVHQKKISEKEVIEDFLRASLGGINIGSSSPNFVEFFKQTIKVMHRYNANNPDDRISICKIFEGLGGNVVEIKKICSNFVKNPTNYNINPGLLTMVSYVGDEIIKDKKNTKFDELYKDSRDNRVAAVLSRMERSAKNIERKNKEFRDLSQKEDGSVDVMVAKKLEKNENKRMKIETFRKDVQDSSYDPQNYLNNYKERIDKKVEKSNTRHKMIKERYRADVAPNNQQKLEKQNKINEHKNQTRMRS